MVDPVARLETMREMLLYAQKLYSWCLNDDFHPIYSNCPSQSFFGDMLSISFCSEAIRKHFSHSYLPIVANDAMGFAWIAAIQPDENSKTYHLLGPIFTVDASDHYLYRLCAKLKLPGSLVDELLKQVKLVATIPMNTAVSYAVMLHYCITGEQISSSQVCCELEASASSGDPEWGETNWHGTWEAELELFNCIREGKTSDIVSVAARFSGGRVGTLCPGDPLRQAKDEHIVFSTLCSRAAILGGVSAEGGYSIADYYVQRAEACNNVSDVMNCSNEMFAAFIQRVRQCKSNSIYSAPVAACMEYIETHILEKINLERMASSIGYTGYYLSGKFQKEVGTSISNYIKQQKIEQAKVMLRSGRLNSADISERLAFSSPSYFGAVFRQYTGMSPGEYREKGGQM